MANEIKINSKVLCPVTDADGEVAYRIGTLVDLNSRYATVKIDGVSVKVGKTKIEAMAAPSKEPKPKKVVTKVKAEAYQVPNKCPHCNIDLSNGYIRHGDEVNENEFECDTNEYCCLACNDEFGPLITSNIIPTNLYEYESTTAASGRPSKDNGDDTAMLLRGQPLDMTYELVSATFDIPIAELKAKYAHLNPGQQRMCLGNRLRKKD